LKRESLAEQAEVHVSASKNKKKNVDKDDLYAGPKKKLKLSPQVKTEREVDKLADNELLDYNLEHIDEAAVLKRTQALFFDYDSSDKRNDCKHN
jgi:hypothetical protein